MPKLTRLRLVCVGHPKARFDDVVLNFQDAASNPADTTLWLRNGGGKSSLLNLFFAVVRPDKRDFLGNKAEQKKRKLEDYVQENDRSVVIAEWETDGERDSLELAGTRERLLTGVFYERRTGGGELRRLYFTCKVASQHSETTLEGLPIFRLDGARKARRPLSAFRQEWQNLRDTHPHLNVSATEHQVEWAEWLEQARIDPELFSYQLRMNQREGGADDLFKFDEAEDFVDFLLDMVLDPSLANGVRTNIETFRRELKDRNETLLPMRELLGGLLSRLDPISHIRHDRDELAEGLSATAARLSALAARLHSEIEAHQAEGQRRGSDAEESRKEAAIAQGRARALEKRVAWLDRHIASQLVQATKIQDDEARARHAEAQRSLKIWQAASYLREALRFERDAAQYREDLAHKHKEQAPLIRELAAAASAFAAALLHQQAALKKEEEASRDSEKALHGEADRLRNESATSQAQASTAIEEARGLEERLKEGKKELEFLRTQGVVLKDETPEHAAQRLSSIIQDAVEALAEAAAGQAQLRGERSATEQAREASAREAAQTAQRASNGSEVLRAAEIQRRKLETDAALLRLLQLESLDLEASAESVVDALRRRLREAAESLVSLRIQRSADERALFSLEQIGLLPPSRDAEKVLKAVRETVPSAWSGWTYLSQNTPDLPGARRKAVQNDPLLALGVVVRDEDFEKARSAVRASSLSLETPIALFKQSTLERKTVPEGLVLGPDSDAYFDLAAGKEELIRKRREADSATARIDEISQERAQAEGLLRSVEAQTAAYPKGWFRRQEAIVQADEAARAKAEAAVKEAVAAIARFDDALSQLAEDAKAAVSRKEQALRATALVESYAKTYGSKIPAWEKSLGEARERKSRAEKRSQERLSAAREAEAAAAEAVLVWTRRSQEQRVISDRLQGVLPHVQGASPKPKQGKIDMLATTFEHLADVFEKKVDEAGLKRAATDRDRDALRSRKMFADALSKGAIIEKEVQKALDGLSDHSAVERCAEDAQQQLMAMTGALGNLKKALEAYEMRRSAADLLYTQLGVTERDRPKEDSVLARAEQEIADKRVDIQNESRRAVALEEKAREHQDAAKDAVQAGELAQLARESVEGMTTRFSTLLGKAAKAQAIEPQLVGDSKSELREIEHRLGTAQKVSEALDEKRREQMSKFRGFVLEPRFRNLTSELVQRFSTIDDAALEASVANYREDLSLHLQITEQHIADKEKHRDLLVQQMFSVAEEGLGLLRRAQRQSVLPATLPTLGGSQFLHISLTVSDDPADRRARLGELVDEWVNTGEVPSAIGLIQQAIRKLARPIRVKVLNPDPDVKAQAVDITEMSRFSGGERLTCAILLYCTLAQLRARTRGLSRSPSSVLLLDNPIGRASRPKFIELQRSVAREMGVQLIYTTGVDDYGALHALPNTIRLRNSRVSRATGEKLVEVDHADESAIATAQVARKESSAGANN